MPLIDTAGPESAATQAALPRCGRAGIDDGPIGDSARGRGVMGDFASWLLTFVSEKGLDVEHRFEVDGPQGMINSIPLSNVITAMCHGSADEQEAIRNQLVALDFANRNVMDYFERQAGVLAI
jgi:hypothetical protein